MRCSLHVIRPRKTGLAVLQKPKGNHANAPVLMLTMHANLNYVKTSLRLGAAGFLSKKAARVELLTVIDVVRTGGRYLRQDRQICRVHRHCLCAEITRLSRLRNPCLHQPKYLTV